MPRPYDFGFAIRPVLRLKFVEEVLRSQRIIVPVPSRPTLIAWLEDGRWEGKKTETGWMVYEDSFRAWVRQLQIRE